MSLIPLLSFFLFSFYFSFVNDLHRTYFLSPPHNPQPYLLSSTPSRVERPCHPSQVAVRSTSPFHAPTSGLPLRSTRRRPPALLHRRLPPSRAGDYPRPAQPSSVPRGDYLRPVQPNSVPRRRLTPSSGGICLSPPRTGIRPAPPIPVPAVIPVPGQSGPWPCGGATRTSES